MELRLPQTGNPLASARVPPPRRRSLCMEVKGVIVVEDARLPTSDIHLRRLDALEQVANRPIAHHVLDALTAAGVSEVVVASSRGVGHEVRESQLRG